MILCLCFLLWGRTSERACWFLTTSSGSHMTFGVDWFWRFRVWEDIWWKGLVKGWGLMEYEFGVWLDEGWFWSVVKFGMMNWDNLVKNVLDLVELWRFGGWGLMEFLERSEWMGKAKKFFEGMWCRSLARAVPILARALPTFYQFFGFWWFWVGTAVPTLARAVPTFWSRGLQKFSVFLESYLDKYLQNNLKQKKNKQNKSN